STRQRADVTVAQPRPASGGPSPRRWEIRRLAPCRSWKDYQAWFTAPLRGLTRVRPLIDSGGAVASVVPDVGPQDASPRLRRTGGEQCGEKCGTFRSSVGISAPFRSPIAAGGDCHSPPETPILRAFPCTRHRSPTSRNRCALSAWRGPNVLVEGVGVLYLKFAPPDRPQWRRKARIIRAPSPAANRLAGDLLIKALIDESERPAKLRPDEIRHRAAGAAQRRPDAGARRGLLHRRRQARGRGLCGDGPQPRSPRGDQEDRHVRRAQDARCARGLYRRRSRRLWHAQMHRAVQEPRRHTHETAAAARAAD